MRSWIFFIFAGVLACTPNQKEPVTETAKPPIASTVKPDSAQSPAMPPQTTGKITPVSKEQLAKFLPEIKGDVEKFAPSSSMIEHNGQLLPTITSEYKYGLGALSITLTDYADAEEYLQPLRDLANLKVSGNKRNYSQVQFPVGKGVQYWDNVRQNGWFSMVVNNRFAVKIEGSRLPNASADLQKVINGFDFNGLAALK